MPECHVDYGLSRTCIGYVSGKCFPPIPSEIVLPVAGTLTISADPEIPAQFNIISVVLWATLGSFIGAWLWYWVGFIIGENRIRRLLQKIGKYIMITEKDLDVSLKWFDKYGDWYVFSVFQSIQFDKN